MLTCESCRQSLADAAVLCPADGTPLPGALVDARYRLVRLLGRGGNGTVFLARHERLGRAVALKFLPLAAGRDPLVAQRFEQEAIAASRIGHPGIVDVLDFGQTPEGALWYAMEALEGRTLADVLRDEGPLPPERVVEVMSQVAGTLLAAHAVGIVHRDLKPANVFLVERPSAPLQTKVLDFGISRFLERVRSAASGELRTLDPMTEEGRLLGTPEYMAPEQVSGEPVDAQADVYALGVVAFELLTGRRPFEGPTTVSVLYEHLHGDVPRPRTHRAEIPARLDRLVRAMLAKAPADRPAGMAGVLEGLAPRPVPTRAPRRTLALGAALLALLVMAVGGVALGVRRPRAGAAAPGGTDELPVRAPAPPIATPPADLGPPRAAPASVAAPTVPAGIPAAAPGRVLTSAPAGAVVWSGRTRLGVTPLKVAPEAGPLRLVLPGHRVRVLDRVPADGSAVHLEPERRTSADLKPDPFQ